MSPPVEIGERVVALGGCGRQLGDGFHEALLAVAGTRGTSWRIERFTSRTGDPLPAVLSPGRVVTLAVDSPGTSDERRVRALVVHR